MESNFVRAAAAIISVFYTVSATSPTDRALAQRVSQSDELKIALSLAKMLQSARSVIGRNQSLINDPAVGNKGLSGDKVLAETLKIYLASPETLEPANDDSLWGKLIQAQLTAISEVMGKNQTTINQKGTGFKGFVPAVFARLANERFRDKVSKLATIKVTAPLHLVRNRKARPDPWEHEIIEKRFRSASWPKGQLFQKVTEVAGQAAFRVLVPEYYGAGCLSCHGGPKGDIDVTGYPKEGGALNDLGGVISITIFR